MSGFFKMLLWITLINIVLEVIIHIINLRKYDVILLSCILWEFSVLTLIIGFISVLIYEKFIVKS